MLIVFQTFDTVVLIAVHTVVNTPLTAFHTVVMIFCTNVIAVCIFALIASQIEMIVSLQFSQINRNGTVKISNAALKNSAIAIITTVITFLIVSKTVDTKSLIVVNMLLTVFQIPVSTSEIVVLTAVHAVVTVFFIPSSIPVKNDTMPFQMFSKVVLMLFHTSSHEVPNKPRKASATPLIVFRILLIYSFSPFHTLSNIPFTASQAPDQSPVNNDTNKSNTPVITFSVVSIMFAILLNTPSMIGANKLQKPSQIALTTSPKFSKSKPSELSLSVMCCPNSVNTVLILSQISVILFLKSSFVFHSVTMTAVIAAIAATAIPTGDVIAASAPFRTAMPPVAPDAVVPIVASLPTTFPIPDDSCPDTLIAFPTIVSKGPIAATTPAIFRIVSCCCGLNAANLSASSPIFATAFSMNGSSAFPTVIPISSSFDFSCVSLPSKLSCIVAAMSDAVPSQFCNASA